MSKVIHFPFTKRQQEEGVVLLGAHAEEWVRLPDVVLEQLNLLVQAISDLYSTENPFHNFEHACNVTLAASKFLNHMASGMGNEIGEKQDGSCGIAKDPLAQFAILLAALFHDADHEGVPSK